MSKSFSLSKTQVTRLRNAIEPYLDTPFPKAGNWRSKSDNELWLSVVNQVAVIGGAPGGDRLMGDKKALKFLAWEGVVKLKDKDALESISTAMREAGVRFVGANPTKGSKSSSLAKNLRVLETAGGPKKYFRKIARKKQDLDKVSMLCGDLSHIGNKSARDLLINLGMIRDAIAFDSRIQKVLSALGIEGYDFNDKDEYRELEEAFLAVVPDLEVSCLCHLDRILFQKNAEVLSRLSSRPSGRRPKASTSSITITLSKAAHAELGELSVERGVKPSELARQLLESILKSLYR